MTTYATGTINDASTYGISLYNAIAAALTAEGWTLVDTIVISTRTHKVWRNDSTRSALGKTWYLALSYLTSGASNVSIRPFEDFDTGGDLGIRGCAYVSATTIESTYFSRFGATGYALDSANWLSATSSLCELQAVGSSFTYWIVVDADHIKGISSTSPTFFRYVGLLEPTLDHADYAGAALLPLALVSNLSGNDANFYTYLTRAPRMTAMLANWNTGINAYLRPHEGAAGVLNGSVSPLINKRRGSCLWVQPSATEAAFGRAKDVAVFRSAAGVTAGDRVTIDGETWVLSSHNSTPATVVALRFPGYSGGTDRGTAYIAGAGDQGDGPAIPTTGQIWPRGN
jgi:hypothetical protein